ATDSRLSAQHIATLNDAMAAAPWFRQVRGRPTRVFLISTGTAVAAALAQIADETVAILTGGRAEVRRCTAPGCLLLFSRRDSRREWCSPACGNRARVLRHYDRHPRRRS